MTESDSKARSGNLPKGLQITPGRFLVLNKSYPNATITIDNLTWTTYAVYIKAPSWINCQKKFMLEAKSVVEFEIVTSIDRKCTQSTLSDKIRITFIDMSNKDTSYAARLLVEYTSYSGHHLSEKEYEASRSVVLLQLSALLMLLSLALLLFHYRFQMRYYLCLFQATLCEFSRADSETPWFRKLFRC